MCIRKDEKEICECVLGYVCSQRVLLFCVWSTVLVSNRLCCSLCSVILQNINKKYLCRKSETPLLGVKLFFLLRSEIEEAPTVGTEWLSYSATGALGSCCG